MLLYGLFAIDHRKSELKNQPKSSCECLSIKFALKQDKTRTKIIFVKAAKDRKRPTYFVNSTLELSTLQQHCPSPIVQCREVLRRSSESSLQIPLEQYYSFITVTNKKVQKPSLFRCFCRKLYL